MTDDQRTGVIWLVIDVVDQWASRIEQESPANAKGTRDSSACMKAPCEQM